ncbi:hypothetical protein [Dyadobacter tibetensis]|uniref:hypothetical protein n=1 Tax=Dyadobacter tibetensis TaxID=1211851 RepID=UPI000471FEC9|nr:hypothetical protein [Dyadobacter tibetensis]
MTLIVDTLPSLYSQLSAFRAHDQYLPDIDRDQLIAELFPSSASELVQRLSDISAAMFGVVLKHAGAYCGFEHIDPIANDTMYNLGKINAARSLDKEGINRDIEGFFKIILITIFTANPEYSFTINRLDEQELKMTIRGVDRYHKIAFTTGIVDHLTWPVISPYLHGINEELGINAKIGIQLLILNEQSQCHYELKITGGFK